MIKKYVKGSIVILAVLLVLSACEHIGSWIATNIPGEMLGILLIVAIVCIVIASIVKPDKM